MNFLNAGIGLFLAVVGTSVVVVLALRFARRRRRRRLEAFVGPVLTERLTSSVDPVKRRWRTVLFVAGMVFTAFAAARPWWGNRLVRTPKRSRDVLVVMDCSRSMLARDVAPSRLEFAKWWVRRLIEQCPGDRFGLIAFAGTAFLECPLTQDRNTFFQFLDLLDTNTIPAGGTNLADALRVARRAFKGAESGHQAVILITDGEELQGDSKKEVDSLVEAGIPLFIVGLGDPVKGAVVQLPDNTFLRDKSGKIVQTRLNEAGLRELSEKTRGIYVRGTTMTPNLKPVLRRVRSLVPEGRRSTSGQRPIERYQAPLFLGILCFLLRLFMGERRGASEGRRSGRALVRGSATVVLCAGLLGTANDAGADAPAGKSTATGASPSRSSPPPGPVMPFTIVPPAGDAGKSARPLGAPAGPGPVGATGKLTPEQRETLRRQAEAAQLAKDIKQTRKELERAPSEHKARLHCNLGYLYQRAGRPEQAETEYQKAIALAHDQSVVLTAAYWNLGVLRHVQARQLMGTKPDEAIRKLDAARDMYREALRCDPGNADIGNNLEVLARDRELAERIKKTAKKLEQMRRDALEKARQAQARQQEANKEKDPRKARQKTEEAARKTAAARDAARKLADALDQLKQKQAADKAKKAREELEKALEAQARSQQAPRTEESRRRERTEAEKRLDAAARLLGGEQQRKQDGKGSGQAKQKGKQKSGKQQQKSGEQKEGKQKTEVPKDLAKQLQARKNEKKGEGEAGKDAKAVNPAQAAAILQKMQEKEEDLRKALLEQQLRNSKLRPVEKNW